MFSNIQELFNSLEADEATPMPVPQIIALMTDLLEKNTTKDLGLLDFMNQNYKKYFNFTRNSKAGGKHLSLVLKSLLKFGKDNHEVRFFAKLANLNVPGADCQTFSLALKLIRSKFGVFNGRTENGLKQIKVTVPEVLQMLPNIFSIFQ